MAKESNQKLKILYLLKFLYEESDDTNFVSMTQILDYLALCGIYAERKSVYSDICELEHFGLDIISRKGKNAGYALASRILDASHIYHQVLSKMS